MRPAPIMEADGVAADEEDETVEEAARRIKSKRRRKTCSKRRNHSPGCGGRECRSEQCEMETVGEGEMTKSGAKERKMRREIAVRDESEL